MLPGFRDHGAPGPGHRRRAVGRRQPRTMNSDLFGYPVLMRAGLGNMLVPWAKCVLWCKDNDAQMIAPFWTKVRIGPFLRFERDKRQYRLLFHHGDQIAGVRRLSLLARGSAMDASDWAAASRRFAGPVVVRFQGMDDPHPLIGREVEVSAALRRITKAELIPANTTQPFVRVHVRMGDFQTASPTELKTGAHCRRIPVEWYADTLMELRRVLGFDMPARIYCDGTDDELRPLLALARVTRVDGGSA